MCRNRQKNVSIGREKKQSKILRLDGGDGTTQQTRGINTKLLGAKRGDGEKAGWGRKKEVKVWAISFGGGHVLQPAL